MEKLSRRDVLIGAAAVGSSAAVLGAMGVASADVTSPPSPPAAPPIVWINVGPLPDMKVNDVQRIAIADSPTHEVVYVRRASDKDYAAFSARCTHRGCTIGYDSTTTVFTCPCHGAQFDNMGNATRLPAKRPLMALATKFDDKKNLWIQSPVVAPPPQEHPAAPPAGLPQ